MTLKSCQRCFQWADSPETVHKILSGQFDPCEGCKHEPMFRVVAQQYQMNQPRWWVVNDALVIPIWVVDIVRKKFTF